MIRAAFWSLSLGMLAVVACNRTSVEIDRPAPETPIELLVPSGATEVKRDGKDSGPRVVRYTVHVTYPAESLISSIVGSVSRDRWRPLERDWLNPENPAGYGRGWESFTDATKNPHTMVHVRNMEWHDDSGNVISYGLKYDSALPAVGVAVSVPDNQNLDVHAAFFPAAYVVAMRKQLGITGAVR